MVFTEFLTSSSVTSTTEQCSSSSGSGSAPPLLSHGCTCTGDTHSSGLAQERGHRAHCRSSCQCCSVSHCQRCFLTSFLGNGCSLAQCCHPLPPTSTTAPSESSWKHFENLSYLERFHLFLSHAAEQSPLSLLPLMGWFLGCEQEESPVRGHGLSTEPSLALETRPASIQGKSPSTPTICAQPGTRASTQLCSSTHRVLQCACKSCLVKSHKYSSKPGFGLLGMEGRDVTTFS